MIELWQIKSSNLVLKYSQCFKCHNIKYIILLIMLTLVFPFTSQVQQFKKTQKLGEMINNNKNDRVRTKHNLSLHKTLYY